MFWTAAQYRLLSRSTYCASNGDRPKSNQGRNSGKCCTCCDTKDHKEPSACSKTRITRAFVRLPFTPRHRQAWVLWCRERVDWRVEWRSFVFSEESRFCLCTSDERRRVRRRPGERHFPDCIRPRHTGLTLGS